MLDPFDPYTDRKIVERLFSTFSYDIERNIQIGIELLPEHFKKIVDSSRELPYFTLPQQQKIRTVDVRVSTKQPRLCIFRWSYAQSLF